MSKHFSSLVAGCLTYLTLSGSCSVNKSDDSLRFMFYNVENLFDTRHDSLKSDRDFVSGGVMRWNATRYRKKIISLYKTIMAAGRREPPDLIAMCEVENRRVLEDLINSTYLSRFGYRIVHEESPDQRGIDVCLIYRACNLQLIRYEYLIPSSVARENFTTRSVLHACFRVKNDSVDLIMNHWPSRRGGVLAGEELRQLISHMVREKADSLGTRSGAKRKIIIAGDFNSAPDDKTIMTLTDDSGVPGCLINLSLPASEKGEGTYRYMGNWEMLDQVIVSCALLNQKDGLFTEKKMLSVFKPRFLLGKDPRYPGYTPFATYKGYRYQGGFSDHLPVLLDLGFR